MDDTKFAAALAGDWTRVVYRAPHDPDTDTLPPDGIRVELLRYTGDPVWHHLLGTVRSYPSPLFPARRCVEVNIHDGVAGSAWYGVNEPPDDWPEPPADGSPADWWRPIE